MKAAGKRNKLVKIQYSGATQDEIGQPSVGWLDLASVFASIKNRTGAESIKSDNDVSIVQVSIGINKRTDVTPSMRVLYGTKAYEIKAVLPDEENNDGMFLVCEQVLS